VEQKGNATTMVFSREISGHILSMTKRHCPKGDLYDFTIKGKGQERILEWPSSLCNNGGKTIIRNQLNEDIGKERAKVKGDHPGFMANSMRTDCQKVLPRWLITGHPIASYVQNFGPEALRIIRIKTQMGRQ